MAELMRGAIGNGEATKWVPWVLLGGVLLFMMGFVDGSVYGVAFGDSSMKLNFVHEFFHHARHVALMCH